MDQQSTVSFITRSSSFGQFAVLWSVHERRPMIRRILLSRPGRSAQQAVARLFPGAEPGTCSRIDKVARQVEAFLEGANIRFSLQAARLDLCSAFQVEVLRAEHGIPRGCVSTYQRIAAQLGRPQSARAVGMALARNPFPILVPCHRAIRSDRHLGGYQGGLAMKRKLLEMEGAIIDDSGRVVTATYFY